MKPNRIALFAFVAAALIGLAGCSGNNSADTEAEVYLSQNIPTGVADVDISVASDVAIPNMTISCRPKSPDVTLSQQDDVILTEWVVTCARTDGGTVASPQWTNFEQIYVPANSSTSLVNYRIFPSEYFQQAPLNQLFPVNGNLDKETGNHNIRQRLHIALYGKTVAGKKVSLEFDITLNFFYQNPNGVLNP